MKSLKNSKFKNTGILFELLVQNITSDILNNQEPNALSIIKEFFNKKTELNRELKLYQAIMTQKFNSDSTSLEFVNGIIGARKRLDETKLNQEKFNLVKRIKKNFNIDEFFQGKLKNYKALASTYKLFEYSLEDNPIETVRCKQTLVEQITKKDDSQELTSLNEEFTRLDKSMQIVVFKTMVEKFNKKYSSLNSRQTNLLKEYVNSVVETPSLKNIMQKEAKHVKMELLSRIHTITEPTTKIKINEAIQLLDKMDFSKGIKENHFISLMRYLSIVEELDKIKK